ncbi:hypothetical protein [Microbacterium gilvum]|uniref:Uncharacterized protein n=1 Tax=Microbacterium gilvum TaxID=1336204 RepID=A0ABP8ZQT5_9MICO
MTALRYDVEDAVQGYLAQPANFGDDDAKGRLAEADAFRAGVEWAEVRTIPGAVPAGRLVPGDVVEAEEQQLAVVAVRTDRDVVRLITWTQGGAEVVLERGIDQLVDVVETGAFRR